MDESGPGEKDAGKGSFRRVLRIRDLRFLLVGQSISELGSQFYIIALPWLVLILTNDPFVLGTVMAVAAVPRAMFMLFGGAMTDRASPRGILILSNIIRTVVVVPLTILVIYGSITIWLIYALTFVFGVADAFFFPALFALPPTMVKKRDLQITNSLVQGLTQFTLFLGPVIAGVMIALFSQRYSDMIGVASVLVVDAASFLASILFFWMMRKRRRGKTEKGTVASSVREGLSYIWKDVTLRTIVLVTMGMTMLVTGPIVIGIPVLAKNQLPQGAAAYGAVMGAFGGGSLLGIAMAGTLPRPRPSVMGKVIILLMGSLGIEMLIFSQVGTTPLAALMTLLMGAATGYVVILILTWLQHRTPREMMGRMMGVAMFASVGVAPISFAVAGAVIAWSYTSLYIVSGVLILAISLRVVMMPEIRKMGEEL